MRLTDRYHGGVPADHFAPSAHRALANGVIDCVVKVMAFLLRVFRPTWSYPMWWLYRHQRWRERQLTAQVGGHRFHGAWAASAATLAFGVGATMSGFPVLGGASATGLIATPIYNVIEAPFNATGNGSTDDSAAFTAAFTAAHNATFTALGGTVYVPFGKYYWASNVTTTLEGLTIIGDGQVGVSDEYATGSTQILTGAGVWGLTLGTSAMSEHRGYRVENMQFYEKTASTGLGGVQVLRVSDCTFKNVAVGRYLAAGGVGFLVDGTGDQAQYTYMSNCRFGRCAAAGYQQKAANGTRHIGCYFDGAENGSLAVLAGSVGCLITSGDTYISLGTLYSGAETLVSLGPNIGHQIVGARFEFFTVAGVTLSNGTLDAYLHGNLDNSSHANAGTGCVIPVGAVNTSMFMTIANVQARVSDQGTATRYPHAGGLAIGGPSVLGSVVGRQAVYNEADTLIGYMPIYNTINGVYLNQFIFAASASATGQSSIAHTVPAAVPAGDTIVIGGGYGLGSTVTVSAVDSRGNSYQVDQHSDLLTGQTPHSFVLSAAVTTALQPGDTITVSFTSPVNYPIIFAYDFAGMPSSSWVDTANASTTGTGTALSSGSITTASANDLLFCMAYYSNTSAPTFTAGSGYTELNSNGTTTKIGTSQSATSGAAGTITNAATATLSQSEDWAISLVAYAHA